MYARLVRFNVAPGDRAVAQSVVDDLVPQIKAHEGCQGVTVFGNVDEGQWGAFVLWDTEANADAAAHVIRPQFNEHLNGHTTSDPEFHLYEVLSP